MDQQPQEHDGTLGPKLYAPVEGAIAALSECSDTLFATGKMGPGFVVFPTSGEVHSPVSGTVRLINANGHGFGIDTDNGHEVLVHLGTDTGDLDQENGRHPFSAYVSVGEHICAGQLIAGMKNSMIRAAGRSDEVVVVIDDISEDEFELSYTGPVKAGQVVGHLV